MAYGLEATRTLPNSITLCYLTIHPILTPSLVPYLTSQPVRSPHPSLYTT